MLTIPVDVASDEHLRKARALAAAKHKGKLPAAQSTHASTLLSPAASAAALSGALQAACFVSSHVLMTARGDALRPQFDTAPYQQRGELLPSRTLDKFTAAPLVQRAEAVTDDTRKRRLAEGGGRGGESGERTVLSAADASAAMHHDKRSSAALLSGASSSSSSAGAAGVQPRSALIAQSLAQRIAEMEQLAGLHANSSFDRISAPNAAAAAAAAAGAGALVPSSSSIAGELPKSGSLQTLLTQALHTNDEGLFEFLSGSQQRVVDRQRQRQGLQRVRARRQRRQPHHRPPAAAVRRPAATEACGQVRR